MAVFDILPRIKARREHEFLPNRVDGVPVTVLRALCEAIKTESAVPLEDLPSPWRQQARASWHRIMGTPRTSAKVLPLDRRCVRRRGA